LLSFLKSSFAEIGFTFRHYLFIHLAYSQLAVAMENIRLGVIQVLKIMRYQRLQKAQIPIALVKAFSTLSRQSSFVDVFFSDHLFPASITGVFYMILGSRI